ncbi:putative ATP-dependent helicase [marine gamma proteobacterium HTCC2143]|uniref:Putative ATP-dependent helicase n=1 Tax=marine gamma proteobacterium HTCC2143 TaxID=247633 RepID=A0YD52_9GAMM|nr:putative ATP-dependent helicase [marine gamma proteobacterium HTCC2143]
MYSLRPYQQQAVDATVSYFRTHTRPACIVLPTGAGKSLVIAELARIANGRVLVLAHVKELVEQNHDKFASYGLESGIYSAGLDRKDVSEKVIFGSVQSIARSDEQFFNDFSLVIIDECHRVSLDQSTQYQQVLTHLQTLNEGICILGLTATPYRLGMGWIYQYHMRGMLRTDDERFFSHCIYELSLAYMIRHEYLTPPVLIDSPVACYDFSTLELNRDGRYTTPDIESILQDQSRITPSIVAHITELAKDRMGIMLFTSTVRHAKEVLSCLPSGEALLVTGETPTAQRDQIISHFKTQQVKYLVNVSVLTTGFDAPHVDLIAILRPTDSVALYQQIIGRGLRRHNNKTDCLILDYTGLGHDIFSPEIGEKKPNSDSETVDVICPQCGYSNVFWGIKQEDFIVEHYGRKCLGAFESIETHEIEPCGYLFRFKRCPSCQCENDISKRYCSTCNDILIDPDAILKDAMSLKDAHILRCDSMTFERDTDKQGNSRLEVRYYDLDGEYLSEYFYFDSYSRRQGFYYNFVRSHIRNAGATFDVQSLEQVYLCIKLFAKPRFIVARKVNTFWKIREKIFDWDANFPRQEEIHFVD